MAKPSEVKTQAMATQTATIPDLIKKSVGELGKALPSHMSAERLVRIALTTLRMNPELYKCTPESFLAALFQSAQLGLEPNIEGQAYILPFNNRRKIGNEWKTFKEAQFQIGYKGYAELFYRHEKAMGLDMQKVGTNDTFEYMLGTEAYIKHKPASERGEITGFYAVATLANGAKLFKYMSKSECMEHAQQYSKTWDKKVGQFLSFSPWATNPDAMCMKTVLMQLMKLLPKSIEIQRALAMDETIKTKVAMDMFNVPDKTEWNNKEVIDVKPEANHFISTEQIRELETIIEPFRPAAMERLASLYKVDDVAKIQVPWYDDILHWAKNYKG
jgi:recombination protein RecT